MASPNEKDDVPTLPISDSSRSVSLAITSSTIDDDAKGWTKRFATSVNRYLPRMINPHSTLFRIWTKLFALSALVAIFIDPIFFFLIKTERKNRCIMIDWPTAKAFIAVRSVTDVLFFVNVLLKFRLAPESTGAGQLVDNPIKFSWADLILEVFIGLPLPQIRIVWVMPAVLGTSITFSKVMVENIVIIQYLPKLFNLLPLIAGQTPTGFFPIKPAWANCVKNLLTFMLAGHVVGTLWYFFGLSYVELCLHAACRISPRPCRELIVCGHGNTNETISAWRVNTTACYREGGFRYGIFMKAVNLTNHTSLFTRYFYSLFWGFQQITTLTGGQVPNYDSVEVFFTMGIIGLGLLLFPLLMGNMNNFFQTRGQRNLETKPLTALDLQQWISHRRLPEGIRKRVVLAEWVNWAATRGFNENLLFENMPNDLQRDIRRRLFLFLKKVRIFLGTDKSIFDAIRERLKQRTYISNSTVLDRGGPIEEMVFIVRGEMESIGQDRSVLSEGDFCGEELLTWCLEHSSENPEGTSTRIPSKGLVSNRSVRCLTDVEAFSLSVADIEDITSLFLRFLRSHGEKGAMTSPHWRQRAARKIQLPWRHRRRR